MTVKQRAAIRKEMKALKKLQDKAKTGHGAGCALCAYQALEWVLCPSVAPPPSAFAEFADYAADSAKDRNDWAR